MGDACVTRTARKPDPVFSTSVLASSVMHESQGRQRIFLITYYTGDSSGISQNPSRTKLGGSEVMSFKRVYKQDLRTLKG